MLKRIISFSFLLLVPQDSIREKTSACSRNDELNHLREEGRFLNTYSPVRRGREPANEASVEYLQEVARIRLCLDRASDFLSQPEGGPGKSSLPCFTLGLKTPSFRNSGSMGN